MDNGELLSKIFDIDTVLDKKQSYILFGADVKGSMVYDLLTQNGFTVNCFVDNDTKKHGVKFGGLDVFPADMLVDSKESKIILTISPVNIHIVYNQLDAMGISRERVITPKIGEFAPYGSRSAVLSELEKNKDNLQKVECLLEDENSKNVLRGLIRYCDRLEVADLMAICDRRYPQYFDEELIVFGDGEVFIDGGCLDFSTSLEFIGRAARYKKIYAFEPDKHNFVRVKEIVKGLSEDLGRDRIEIINKGIYSDEKIAAFDAKGSFDSRVVDVGANEIELDSLDNTIDEASFIKFDIEGCEYEGLLGSRRIIQQCRPKLAISVYHKLSDLWKIPLLIKELYGGYRLYFRQYNDVLPNETICYAIPEGF